MDRPNYRLQDEVACYAKEKAPVKLQNTILSWTSNIAGRFQANPALLTDEIET